MRTGLRGRCTGRMSGGSCHIDVCPRRMQSMTFAWSGGSWRVSCSWLSGLADAEETSGERDERKGIGGSKGDAREVEPPGRAGVLVRRWCGHLAALRRSVAEAGLVRSRLRRWCLLRRGTRVMAVMADMAGGEIET
jgi:hypothetical protein